ncbi:MAG: (p)ppGpp synthetase, partial [Clostridiales bacterium]|jgi:GTP pyrophosphokinase|nr:(p)ppGpp synthetase [Clostridiales bacterium]
VLKVISKIKEQCNKLIEQKREEETVKELETQRSHHTEAQTQKRRNQEIIVHGIDNCLVRFAKCCNPVRGDQIRGYITRGRGVSIHRADCTNVQNDDPDYSERMIEVSWGEDAQASYLSNLKVVANNRTGLIANITSKISELKIPIHSVDARTVKSNTMIINLTLDIQSKEHLEKLTKKIAKLQGIISVDRSIN